MSTEAVEKELIQLEKQYWQAMKDKDVDTAMRLNDAATDAGCARSILRRSREIRSAGTGSRLSAPTS